MSKAMQFNKLWVITFLWQRGPEKFVLLYKRIWDSTKMPDWTLMEFEDIKGIFIKLIPKLLWIKEFSFMKWNSAMHFRLKVNRELAYQYKANVCNSQEFIAFIYEMFVSPLLRKVFSDSTNVRWHRPQGIRSQLQFPSPRLQRGSGRQCTASLQSEQSG